MTTLKRIYATLVCFVLCVQLAYSQQKPEPMPPAGKESFRINAVKLDSNNIVAVNIEVMGNIQPVQGDFKLLNNEDGTPIEIHQLTKAGNDDNANLSTRLVYFLIDASNYTDGMPLNNFKSAVKGTLRQLTENDLMNVGYFGGEELITFSKDFNANVGAFESDIQTRITANTDSNSKSNAFKAMYDAIDAFKTSNKDGQRILIVVSGGVKNANSEFGVDDVALYARKNNVTIHNVAYKTNAPLSFDGYRIISSKTESGLAIVAKTSTDIKNAIGNFLEKRTKINTSAALYTLTFQSPFKDGAEHKFKISYANTDQIGTYIAPKGNGQGGGIMDFLTHYMLWIGIIVLLLGGLLYWQLNEIRLRRIEREEEELQQQEDAERARQAENAKREKQQDAVIQELRNQTSKLEEQMRQKENDLIKRTEDLKSQMQFTPTVVPASKFDMKNTIISGGGGAPVLLVSAGSFSNNFYLNKPSMMVGRAANNDIVIPEQTVSNQHATITIENGSFFLSDLGSTNGTFVNGTRIDKKLLKAGDIIKFGASNCRFEI